VPSKRRLFGIDRSGPSPSQTRRGAPLHPWTLPNLVGYLRLASIPVFVIIAFAGTSSCCRGGRSS
jgi:hypothetical protein